MYYRLILHVHTCASDEPWQTINKSTSTCQSHGPALLDSWWWHLQCRSRCNLWSPCQHLAFLSQPQWSTVSTPSLVRNDEVLSVMKCFWDAHHSHWGILSGSKVMKVHQVPTRCDSMWVMVYVDARKIWNIEKILAAELQCLAGAQWLLRVHQPKKQRILAHILCSLILACCM